MEYEYSIKVKNIDEYLDYCKKNNYKKEKEIKQTRTVYKKTKHKIARITVEEAKTTTKVLDFKEDRYSKDNLNIRKESKPLLIIDEKVAEEVLNFLGYKKKVTLVRNRIIFRKNQVKFEIDEYFEPEKAFVVAIEGEQKEVDQVYKELDYLNKKYKLDD